MAQTHGPIFFKSAYWPDFIALGGLVLCGFTNFAIDFFHDIADAPRPPGFAEIAAAGLHRAYLSPLIIMAAAFAFYFISLLLLGIDTNRRRAPSEKAQGLP